MDKNIIKLKRAFNDVPEVTNITLVKREDLVDTAQLSIYYNLDNKTHAKHWGVSVDKAFTDGEINLYKKCIEQVVAHG